MYTGPLQHYSVKLDLSIKGKKKRKKKKDDGRSSVPLYNNTNIRRQRQRPTRHRYTLNHQITTHVCVGTCVRADLEFRLRPTWSQAARSCQELDWSNNSLFPPLPMSKLVGDEEEKPSSLFFCLNRPLLLHRYASINIYTYNIYI